MNNSGLIVGPLQTTQFLSVVSYISTLSHIFYSQNLIEEEEQFQPFPIINAYFKYLDECNDEMNTKKNLVQRMLQGSELYGGRENETLDVEYINATFDYIISNAVFSQYGNIYGYLANIVNLSNNLTLSSIKNKTLDNLSHLVSISENFSISKLSSLAREKIAETLIWPLFPQPKEDVNIIDVNYIYAQAGLNFARSLGMNLTNITYDDCIAISVPIELTAMQNTIDPSALHMFTLPAFLYYAYKEKIKFRNQNVAHLVHNSTFRLEAYYTLFLHLNQTFQTVYQEAIQSSPLYDFHYAMSKFKNRTLMAEEILRNKCPVEKESDYESAVNDYKLYASSTRCPQDKNKLLPNVDHIYSNQVNEIKEKYRLLIKLLIQEGFQKANLINVINAPDTTVMNSFIIPFVLNCGRVMCKPHIPYLDPSIFLFAIRHEGNVSFYAMIQNEDNISVISDKDGQEKFLRRLGLSKEEKFGLVKVDFLKNHGENFNTFVNRLTDIKAEDFRKQLHALGYEKTFEEKMVDFFLAFVPFYHCITYAKAGEVFEATMSCIIDIISLIPLAGQVANLGYKFSSIAVQRLFLNAGVSFGTFSLRHTMGAALNFGFKEAILGASAVVEKVILTRQMMKNLFINIIRLVDPGIELFGSLLHKGGLQIGKVFEKILANKVSSFGVSLEKYEKIWIRLRRQLSKTVDDITMIPVVVDQVNSYEIFLKTYPGGIHPSGPKYVRLPEGNAEMRRVIGFKSEVPVIVWKVTKWSEVYYKKIDLTTLKPYGLQLKVNKEGLLQPVKQPFRKHIYTIVTEGLSGRGKLLKQKAEVIEEAVELISNSKPEISKKNAREILRNYFLIVKRNDALNDNLMNLKLNIPLKKDLDVDNPDVVKQLIGEDHITIDPNLNQYLIMPTYNDFALDWIRTGQINEVYKKWYIEKPFQFEELLYFEKLDYITEADLQLANRKIINLYGNGYQERMNIKVSEIIHDYDRLNSLIHVNFEDYFAIKNLLINGFNKIKKNMDAKKNLQIALFRLAVRQANLDVPNFSSIVYQGELVDEKILPIFQPKISFKTLNFLFSSMIEKETYNSMGLYNDLNPLDLRKPILYEIHLDSPLSIANVDEVFPTEHKSVILLPDVEYEILEVTEKQILGRNVKFIKLRNKPILKEASVLDLIRKIEGLLNV